jgi:hypothetical protein
LYFTFVQLPDVCVISDNGIQAKETKKKSGSESGGKVRINPSTLPAGSNICILGPKTYRCFYLFFQVSTQVVVMVTVTIW